MTLISEAIIGLEILLRRAGDSQNAPAMIIIKIEIKRLEVRRDKTEYEISRLRRQIPKLEREIDDQNRKESYLKLKKARAVTIWEKCKRRHGL